MSARQTLEAMEHAADIAEGSTTPNSLPHIAKLLRAAIAREEAQTVEPVGWLKAHKYEDGKTLYSFTADKKHVADWAAAGVVLQPVYTTQQEPVNAELLDALKSVVQLAEEAYEHWDNDRDAKVGKYLLALSGSLTKYGKRFDAIHEAIAKAVKS